MNKRLSVIVSVGMPDNIFDAATAVLRMKDAFDELVHNLKGCGITAEIGYADPANATDNSYAKKRHPVALTPWRTAERMALIRSLYVSDRPFREIVERVNALPGPAPASKSAICGYANSQGLRRPIVTAAQQRAVRARNSRVDFVRSTEAAD